MGVHGELGQVKYNRQAGVCVCVRPHQFLVSCFKVFKSTWKCRQSCYSTQKENLELTGLLCSAVVAEVASVYTELSSPAVLFAGILTLARFLRQRNKTDHKIFADR